jgi:hypothetical protein
MSEGFFGGAEGGIRSAGHLVTLGALADVQ